MRTSTATDTTKGDVMAAVTLHGYYDDRRDTPVIVESEEVAIIEQIPSASKVSRLTLRSGRTIDVFGWPDEVQRKLDG